MERPAHALSVVGVIKALKSDKNDGLSPEEVLSRRKKFGLNHIEHRSTLLVILVRNCFSYFTVLLVAAGVISSLIGHQFEAMILWVVAACNALISFAQEARSASALASLGQALPLQAVVVRSNHLGIISAKDLVPGDIVHLVAGDRVPADLRLIEALQFRVDQSLLSGESQPVEKHTRPVVADELLSQANMVFSGTSVVGGRAVGIVVKTGTASLLGELETTIGPVESSPLERKLWLLSRSLTLILTVVFSLVLLIQISRGAEATSLAIWFIALLVAAVPESLPTVVTAALARVSRELAGQKAIVRRLSAVEGLGEVTVIVTDKTGTLTRNEQTVVELSLYTPLRLIPITVTGRGYQPEGVIELPRGEGKKLTDQLHQLLTASVLNNDAAIEYRTDGKGPIIFGDPLEAAHLVLAEKYHLNSATVRRLHPRLAELPFHSASRLMMTFHRDRLIVKGAPEAVIPLCQLSKTEQRAGLLEAKRLARNGQRVLAFAQLIPPRDKERADQLFALVLEAKHVLGLELLGLSGSIDPERATAELALQSVEALGVRVMIVTGDHLEAALQLAKKLSFPAAASEILTGSQIKSLDEQQLRRVVRQLRLVARCGPEEKLRLVQALELSGERVAAVGDGLNDTWILEAATVGVSLGQSGTDAARASSDIILVDDRLTTLVKAISLGRNAVGNISQGMIFLFSSNLTELLVVGLGLLFVAFPLTAIQLLWMNLVTDLFPAIALVFRNPSHNQMVAGPEPSHTVMSRLATRALFSALLGTAVILPSLYFIPVVARQSFIFASLSFFQIGLALSLMHQQPILSLPPSQWFSQLGVIRAVVISLIFTLLPFAPEFRSLFGLSPLNSEWAVIAIVIGGCGLAAGEAGKMAFGGRKSASLIFKRLAFLPI